MTDEKKVPPPRPPPPAPDPFKRRTPDGGGRVENIDEGTRVTDTFAPPPKPKK